MLASLHDRVRLDDGRCVGYAQYGDPDGKPVLHFHGNPSSRFEGHLPHLQDAASRLGVRVIFVERPGIGQSDFLPYTIADWPDMVAAFADALQIDDFAVVGLSAGGKYAAACAWKIPDRVSAAGIISGTCPYDRPETRATLSRQDRLMYGLANGAPWLLRMMLWKIARDVRSDPYAILSLFPDVDDADKVVLADASVRSAFTEAINGAFAQGTRGVALDWKLEGLPWGFQLEDVQLPVRIWHGAKDAIVPLAQAEYLAAMLPRAHHAQHPDDGHVSLYVNHYEEILGTLVA